jgi:hypothetical protein
MFRPCFHCNNMLFSSLFQNLFLELDSFQSSLIACSIVNYLFFFHDPVCKRRWCDLVNVARLIFTFVIFEFLEIQLIFGSVGIL